MANDIIIIAGPAIEPVTLAEVKLHTHIDHDVEDDILNSWIKTARTLAQDYQRRAYITQTLELSLDGFPGMPYDMPRSPLQSIESIKYYDYEDTENVFTVADLYVDIASDPGRIGFDYNITWPTTILRELAAVKIQFKAGYGDATTDIPENVRDAIFLYCTFRNENRAGETDKVPSQFLDLLRQDRL